MTARLASKVLVSALIRTAESAGGFAAVVRRGDPDAGAVLIQTLEKGRISGLWERMPSDPDTRKWQRVGPQDTDSIEEMLAYVARRIDRDHDLWLVELDIANAERFVAETATTD